MHDIHDGATLQSIISVTSGPEAEIVQLSWFCNDTPSEEIPFPDLLRRLNKPVGLNIAFSLQLLTRLQPGSAFSVLAMLPTLDKLPTQPSGQRCALNPSKYGITNSCMQLRQQGRFS